MPALRLNDGAKVIAAAAGDTVLAALARQSVFLPSACGGRGLCGLCKCRIKGVSQPLTAAEMKKLTPPEQAENMRLACQVRVESDDLEIAIAPALLSIQEWEVVIERITDLTHDIKGFRLRLPRGARIPFKAGQYVQITIPPYGQVAQPVMRAYSIASAPSDNRGVDLIIRRVPGGLATTFLFEQAAVGNALHMSGPYGEFYLRESDRPIIMIAGASGLAPLRSILLDMIERKIFHRPTALFFGALSRRDLFAVEEMQAIAAAHKWFRYVPALSQDPEATDYEQGLVTEVVDRHYDRLGDYEAYLCGNPGMIDACVRLLKAKGLSEALIYYDKFM
ncbi:MAG: FAD-binding oxidoreductase [Planctomycetota bacterium]|nr:FAD-binding oxidoreductase [Planctomycetota bacterium]